MTVETAKKRPYLQKRFDAAFILIAESDPETSRLVTEAIFKRILRTPLRKLPKKIYQRLEAHPT
jgi:hypothetical protein